MRKRRVQGGGAEVSSVPQSSARTSHDRPADQTGSVERDRRETGGQHKWKQNRDESDHRCRSPHSQRVRVFVSLCPLTCQQAPLLNPLPFSFRALGGATDDLVSDVLPQFDQLRQEIESDPMFRGLHRMMAMLGGDVPFSGTAQPLPFTLTRGGRFGGEMPPRAESSRSSGSRDIPIVDASSLSSSAPPRENGLRNSAMPHPRDLSEDARMQGPVDSIRHSLDRWTNKLARIVNGTPAQKPRPSADDRSR